MTNELANFPENLPVGTPERMVRSTRRVFESLHDLNSVNSVFPSVPSTWVHVGNLFEDATYTVDFNSDEAIVTFNDEDNALFSEVFGRDNLLTRKNSEGNDEIYFSFKGDKINNVRLSMFLELGTTEEVAKTHLAFEKMMNVITRTMLLHPEREIEWMTSFNSQDRENDLPQKVLDSVLEFGLSTLPINMRILRNMYPTNDSVTYTHQLNRVHFENDQKVSNPFMTEQYSASFEKSGEIKFRLVHAVEVKVDDLNTLPNTVVTEVYGPDSRNYSNKVLRLAKDTNYSAYSHVETAIHDDQNDGNSIVVRFNSANQLVLKNSTSVYTIDLSEGEIVLFDRNMSNIEISSLPIQEKVQLVKLLVVAPRILKNPISTK